MSWTKDTVSHAPKVIFTPGQGEHPAVARLIYDPTAPMSRRYVVELSGISAKNQSIADVEAVIGVG